MYWLALAALICATVFDLRQREIPDSLSLGLMLGAIGMKAAGLHPLGWGEIGLGAVSAFAVSAFLFARGGLGGGDVKLFTALGAVLGAGALLPFGILTGLFGGLAALIGKYREETEIAYAPVMLAGLLSLLPVQWMAR